MANRVTVNVNVRDNSRAGIRAVRNAIRRMNEDIRRSGGQARFRVNVDGQSMRQARRTIQRLQQQLSGGPPVVIRTRVRPPDRNRFRRSIVRALTSPARTSAGIIGGILSDGIGQGIIAGFRIAGPIGMGVFAAIIAGMSGLIGAALSGLLVTALGLAFVSIGGISAAMSEQVKKQWATTLEVLKEQFRSVGEPLIPVLDRALERLASMAEKAGPALRDAIAETAPATEEFLNRLMDGFESFAGEAFGRIMDAWNTFAPVFGEEWNEFMRGLGDAFGDMADLVKEHPTEIAAALDIVFTALEGIIRTVTFLGEVWVFSMQTAGDALGGLLKVARFVFSAIAVAIDLVLMALEGVESLLPGIEDRIPGIRARFNEWSGDAIRGLKSAEDQAFGFDDALNKANKVRKLDADISRWKAKLKDARADLKKTSSQKAEAKVRANIRDLEAKVARARRELASVRSKSVTVSVHYRSDGRSFLGASGRFAHGGVPGGGKIGTAQTGGVRNNMTLVGEQGPELVDLPLGSRVRSNPDTRRLFRQEGGGTPSGTFVFKSSGRRVDDMLIEILRESIKQRGGNPITVLGG